MDRYTYVNMCECMRPVVPSCALLLCQSQSEPGSSEVCAGFERIYSPGLNSLIQEKANNPATCSTDFFIWNIFLCDLPWDC